MTSQQSGTTQQNSGQTSSSNNGSQNSANGQSPSYGGMTNEEVLSGAMEVFNESIMTGQQQGGIEQGNQSSGTLDRTASGAGTTQGSSDASMGQNNGSGTQTGSNGEMQGTGSDAYGDDPFGNMPGSTGAGTENIGRTGQEDGTGMNGSAQLPGENGTGNGSISGSIPGTGQIPGVGGTGYDMSGRRVIVIGDASGVLTGGERVDQYDRELEEQMQVFDGIILGQRQENIARANEDGAGDATGSMPGGNGGFGGDSTFESAPLLTTASASTTADPNNNRTGGVLPDAPGDNREGDYQNQSGANSNIPPDISDGSDDDIVARQLREAAIAERDPELKEKLWDEYRKYKQGVQARR